jgi:hypothetical protein
MTTVQKSSVPSRRCPADQFSEIHAWIVEKDWQTWDAQIKHDSAAGKLDFCSMRLCRTTAVVRRDRSDAPGESPFLARL